MAPGFYAVMKTYVLPEISKRPKISPRTQREDNSTADGRRYTQMGAGQNVKSEWPRKGAKSAKERG
jgi:hypothetical protein